MLPYAYLITYADTHIECPQDTESFSTMPLYRMCDSLTHVVIILTIIPII